MDSDDQRNWLVSLAFGRAQDASPRRVAAVLAARHGGDDERTLALFVRDDDQRILVMASL